MPDKSAIGIDIGGTNLRVARVCGDGHILEVAAEKIDRDPVAVLGRVLDLVARFDRGDVAGVGIGIPGRVNAATGEILSGGYVNLAGVALADKVRESTGKPVLVDGDCNMALVAELQVGAARGCRDVVMLTIGTGIGGAIALDGRIWRGRMSAGQLGHLTVDVNGLPCKCGRRGCVETTSSGTALARLMAEAGIAEGTRVETLVEQIDADGEDPATRVLERWVLPLRAALDTLVATLDPDRILVGGGLGRAAVAALALAPAVSPWYQCEVMAADLGDDAGVIGAALSVLAQKVEAR